MDMDLTEHIIEAVDRYWADEVQILCAWQDGPTGACMIYRRTIDPTVTLGRKFEFHAGVADGTLEGYARDIALNLAEPLGTAAKTSRLDRYGIVWVSVPEDQPTPQPPEGAW
jgi:hypothetical protein